MWFTESKSLVRFLVILCFFKSPTLISGTNTISANQSLSGDLTIVSKGDIFELGFFKAGNSSNYYIGIWYNKLNSNPLSIVWVANRETPISDRFHSELKIIDGNLVLLNESKFQIWSTNVTTTTLKSATAVIHDDGNLVLSDGSNSVKPFWQSFDHPTHTWLPGAKLGYNNITRKSQPITSWRSNEDPSVGIFSVELHPSTREFVLNISEDDDSEITVYVKVASKDLPHHKKRSLLTTGAVVGLVGGVVLVLGLISVLIYRKKRVLVGKTEMEGSLVAFVYKDLQIATKRFSDKLGGGGFGSVFKGVLRDSSIVAVKKLESISQGDKQFRSEVSTIGTIQHVNLVRLRGFCTEGKHKLLVYDYMANGSLDTHLFHEKQVLNWKTRYQIAHGIARGLVYLHDKCRDCIIHCDIKPENILLDAQFCPKVADFGLAKLVGRDFSRVLTTIRGTRGYLAPEWLSGVAITSKADVYSYGMMLFEFVYGKRNVVPCEDSRSKFFPGLVAKVLMEGGDILSLLDSKLNREACVEEVTKICKVACWCIQEEEESRPSMSRVERILDGVSDVSMPPIPQIVTLFVANLGDAVFFTHLP